MVHRIYPVNFNLIKLMLLILKQLFKLNLSIHNDIVSTKIYDKRGDFNFDMVNFPSLDVLLMVNVYLNLFALPEHFRMLLTSFLTAKRFKQGYRYHYLRKAFSKFYRRHCELIEKYHVSLKKKCNKVFVIQNSMEIWYINLGKSLKIQISLIFSNVVFLTRSWLKAMLHSLVARRWFRPQTQKRLRCEALNIWLKLDDCLWLDPPWLN